MARRRVGRGLGMATAGAGVLALTASVLGAAVVAAGQAVAAEAVPATELVSATPSGSVGAGGSAWGGDVSADGRLVAFMSTAADLVPGDTNGLEDVFVRDRLTGTTRLASFGWEDEAGGDPRLSDDGRILAFTAASVYSAYAWALDLGTGEYERVGMRDEEDQDEVLQDSKVSDVSADGRYVLFATEDASLTGGPNSGLFVRDLELDKTIRMDVSTVGVAGNGPTLRGGISANGRFVSFASGSTNLVATDAPLCSRIVPPSHPSEEPKVVPDNCADVFLHDRDPDADGVFDEPGATTVMVSRTSDGRQANLYSGAGAGAVSDSGDVAFVSWAPNLGVTTSDGIAAPGLFLRDHAGTTRRVGDSPSNGATITPDGRYILFDSQLPNGVAGGAAHVEDVLLHDVRTGVKRRIAVDGEGNSFEGGAYMPTMSPDARFVAFSGIPLGGTSEAYLRDRGDVTPDPVPVPVPGTASQQVLGGDTVDTDAAGTGPTAATPVQAEVDVPAGVFGDVAITTEAPVAAPSGFSFFGKQVDVSAPAATAADPYVATFTIDASAMNGMAPANIQVFRNGVLVADCTHAADAVPDPCVAARGAVSGGNGDAYVKVRTSKFSRWNFGRNRAPKVTAAYASPNLLKTPDGTFRTVTIKGVTDPDGNKVTVKVTKVTQDEKVGSSPDARLVSTAGQVKLRAERSATGNGRVYKVYFTATDSRGAKTTGSVKVTVRRYATKAAVDSGQKYPST